MAGIKANQIVYTSFEEAVKKREQLEPHLIKTASILAI
jgi:hypothetical protein